MNRREIKILKSVIHKRLEMLLVLIDSNACGRIHPESDDGAAKRAPDNMFQVCREGPKSTAIEQCEVELTQLTRTLAWLHSPNAGQCQLCSRKIRLAKLKNNPTTRLCEPCTKNQIGELNDTAHR